MRINAPTFTMTPNDLFDHWLPNLGEGELKVLLVIMRKTFGWHKARDRISISQLAHITGLREETVVIATKSLQNKGLIIREVTGQIGRQETYYELIINEDSNNSYPSDQPRTPLGLTPLGSTEAQKKLPSYKETTTTKENNIAAVVPLKKTPQAKIYECLKNTPFEDEFKIKLTKEWKEDQVKGAVEWTFHRDNPPKKSYEASITYALQHGLSMKDIQPSKEESYELNKSYAMKYNGKSSRTGTVEACNTFAGIIHSGATPCIPIEYSDKDFMNKFKNELRKNGFTID